MCKLKTSLNLISLQSTIIINRDLLFGFSSARMSKEHFNCTTYSFSDLIYVDRYYTEQVLNIDLYYTLVSDVANSIFITFKTIKITKGILRTTCI